MKRRTLLLIGLLALSLSVAGCGRGRRAATAETALIEMTVEHGGLERKAFVHLPPGYDDQTPLPLVMAFHGGGGRGEQYARFTKFDALADDEGFIVVFPEGVQGHWYDERFAEAFGLEDQEIDDVGFTLALLETLKQTYAIDGERVYATGISNGGIFCQQLAIEATEHFAAVASATAQIPDVSADMIPQGEISVLLMNGTDDPLVPYDGGQIVVALSEKRREQGQGQTRGSVLSTDETIAYWLRNNGLTGEPVIEEIEDKDEEDGATAVVQTWSDGRVSVVLYRIDQGGHTYPGGPQYLPKSAIGNVCRDFDATAVIWDFLRQHSR